MHLAHLFVYAIALYAAFWAIWYAILLRPTHMTEFAMISFMILKHVVLFTIGGLIVLFLF